MVNVQARPFYLVSLSKLALLFFVTQGGFTVVWFFLHWQAQNKTQANQVYAIPRAIFSLFFIGDLCRRLQALQQKQDVHYPWSPQRLSAVFIVVALIKAAIFVGINMDYLSLGWEFLIFAMGMVQFYVLYQFQLVANRVMGDPFGQENKTITPVNTLWIGFGLFMWGATLVAWFGDAPTT